MNKKKNGKKIFIARKEALEEIEMWLFRIPLSMLRYRD
jgi:hypothetical protein